jgi:DNA-binding transcriptional ArsR family regulator
VDRFAVLAEPIRRQILDELCDGEQPVNELVQRLRVSQPKVSKHLKVLRDAGMVTVRVDAQRRFYRVRLQAVTEIDSWLEPYRAMWAAHLDALEAHLDRKGRPQ